MWVSQWLICLLMLWMWTMGFACAWGITHDHEPFWRGYNDVTGLRLRFIWMKVAPLLRRSPIET